MPIIIFVRTAPRLYTTEHVFRMFAARAEYVFNVTGVFELLAVIFAKC
jgi:hypothetical protein